MKNERKEGLNYQKEKLKTANARERKKQIKKEKGIKGKEANSIN